MTEFDLYEVQKDAIIAKQQSEIERKLTTAEQENEVLRKELDETRSKLKAGKEDSNRIDWLENHIVSSEPASYWSRIDQRWMWRWMGRNFETLRSAVDAAIQSDAKEGKK